MSALSSDEPMFNFHKRFGASFAENADNDGEDDDLDYGQDDEVVSCL